MVVVVVVVVRHHHRLTYDFTQTVIVGRHEGTLPLLGLDARDLSSERHLVGVGIVQMGIEGVQLLYHHGATASRGRRRW